MSLLTGAEKESSAAQIRELILASDQEAVVLRCVPGERLYGSDDQVYAEIGPIRLEMVRTPPEDLNKNIDATACVLPDADVHPTDRLRIGDTTYRLQTLEEENLFGVVTHKVLKLVAIHGS